MKSFLSLCSLILIFSCTHTKKNNSPCSTLISCLDVASKLTGKSYLFDDMSLKEQVGSVGNVTWTKENSDLLIGELLASAGYYRLSMGDEIYKLINARDVRYISAVESFTATKDENDTLPAPNSADPVELVYRTKNGLERTADIARNLRPFMTRYGRVIDQRSGGLIIVRDSAKSVVHLLDLIRKMDLPITKQERISLDRLDRMEELREKTRIEMAKRLEEMVSQARENVKNKNLQENAPKKP